MGRQAKLKAQRKAERMDPQYQRDLRKKCKQMINRGFGSYEKEFVGKNVYAMLAVLVTGFGFGPKRLERFVKQYQEVVSGLCEYYDFNVDEAMPECERIVRDAGFSLDNGFWEWTREKKGGPLNDKTMAELRGISRSNSLCSH